MTFHPYACFSFAFECFEWERKESKNFKEKCSYSINIHLLMNLSTYESKRGTNLKYKIKKTPNKRNWNYARCSRRFIEWRGFFTDNCMRVCVPALTLQINRRERYDEGEKKMTLTFKSLFLSITLLFAIQTFVKLNVNGCFSTED